MDDEKTNELSQKDKMLNAAKVCYVITKVLYVIACVATLVFIALAIALPLTGAIKTLKTGEVAIIFSIAAFYAFMLIGLLWNVEQLFKSIYDNKTPFNEMVTHYLKKTAWFAIVTSIVPALIGSILIRAIVGESEVRFDFQIVGFIVGIITLLLGYIFNYGITLQKKDDETL